MNKISSIAWKLLKNLPRMSSFGGSFLENKKGVYNMSIKIDLLSSHYKYNYCWNIQSITPESTQA